MFHKIDHVKNRRSGSTVELRLGFLDVVVELVPEVMQHLVEASTGMSMNMTAIARLYLVGRYNLHCVTHSTDPACSEEVEETKRTHSGLCSHSSCCEQTHCDSDWDLDKQRECMVDMRSHCNPAESHRTLEDCIAVSADGTELDCTQGCM